MFKHNPDHAAAHASLTSHQRIAFAILVAGAILPIVFSGVIRPVFWLIAFQLACVTGIAYIRWRSPRIGGSVLVVALAAIACLVSVAAGLAA